MAQSTPWPHAPRHQLSQSGTYFVTAATYFKVHHFRGAKRLTVLERGLLKLTAQFGWHPEALGRVLKPLPLCRSITSRWPREHFGDAWHPSCQNGRVDQ